MDVMQHEILYFFWWRYDIIKHTEMKQKHKLTFQIKASSSSIKLNLCKSDGE